MTWQFLTALSVLSDVGGRLLQRVILQEDKSDPVVYAIIQQLLAGIFLCLYAFYSGFKLPDLQPIYLNLILMIALYGVAQLLIFKALKLTEVSIFTILFASRAIWVIFGAILLLNEAFTKQQFFGAFLILLSLVIISWKGQKIRLQKGELLTILAAFLFAAAILNDAIILKTFDVASYVAVSWFSSGLFMLAIHPNKIRSILRILPTKKTGGIALLALTYSFSSITYYFAYKLGNNAAQIGTLFQVSAIITVLAAIFILRERSSLITKIIAGILSFIGVLLVK